MEALILLLILLILGYNSFPLYTYFVVSGVYSLAFFDVGVVYWSVFFILAAIFLIQPSDLDSMRATTVQQVATVHIIIPRPTYEIQHYTMVVSMFIN